MILLRVDKRGDPHHAVELGMEMHGMGDEETATFSGFACLLISAEIVVPPCL